MSKQQGFTLIESLMTMTVLLAIATITVKSVGQFSFDNRYQITQDRYEKIKTAILGNPNQTINGHPSVSGFVADMGRLPHCLRELIDGTNCNPDPTDAGYCSDGTSPDPDTCLATAGNLWKDKLYQIDSACSDSTYTTQNDCEINLKKWIPITGLGYGWRGSYIETTNDPNNSNAITDGWGNTAKCFDLANYPQNSTIQDTCESNGHKWFGYSNLDDIPPDFNYGWFFDNYTESGELTIKSYGRDGLLDELVTPMVDYDKDFPENTAPMITSNDWNTSISPQISITSTIPIVITPTQPTPPTPLITATSTCTILSGSDNCSLLPTASIRFYYKQDGIITHITDNNVIPKTLNSGSVATTATTVCTATTYTVNNPPTVGATKCSTTASTTSDTICSCTNTTFYATTTSSATQQALLFSMPSTAIPIGKVAFSVNFLDSTTIIPSTINPNKLPVILDAIPRQIISFPSNW